jgi:hypothetical protein
MRAVELYRSLLGLTAPWTVAGVEVDLKGQQVVVRVEAEPGPYPCPEAFRANVTAKGTRQSWVAKLRLESSSSSGLGSEVVQ